MRFARQKSHVTGLYIPILKGNFTAFIFKSNVYL